MNYNIYINSNDKMSGKIIMLHFKLIGMIFYQEIINIIMLLFLFKLPLVIIKIMQQIVNSMLIVKLIVIFILKRFLLIHLQKHLQ